MSKPYNVCRHCGAHLDHGEHCECEDREQESAAEETDEATVD